jgi:hypothetical protein
MAEWLCCLARATKVLCSNLGAIRHTSALLASMWLVSVYGELKWLSEGTLRQAGLLSRATASKSCRENIGLSKLSSNSTLYLKVAERRGYSSSSSIVKSMTARCLYKAFLWKKNQTIYYHRIHLLSLDKYHRKWNFFKKRINFTCIFIRLMGKYENKK